MEIKVTRVPADRMKPKPTDESKLGFGQLFTDHFFTMQYRTGKGWHDPHIEPYRALQLDPAAMSLHYGQLIFEGLKAYRGADGSVYLFRPWENIRRMNASAVRLCMPPLDEAFALEALRQLVVMEKDWIPKGLGTSMYIRPTMLATEPALGVRPANEYLYFVIVGPVGAYYPQGFSPTKIWVEEEYVRAVRGGIGYCKAAGNYAASLMASQKAAAQGYTQVLWLDSATRSWVEEGGTMNFLVITESGELVTPDLNGRILAGITRMSCIELLRSWGDPVEERDISIDEVLDAARKGLLEEAFGTGTAAVISPIGELNYGGEIITINGGRIGPLSQRLYDTLTGIQWGRIEDTFGWTQAL